MPKTGRYSVATTLSLVLAATTAGCSAPEQPLPEPTAASATPPSVAKPVDLVRYRDKPCDAVPEEADAHFRFDKRTTHKDRPVFREDGPQPACALSRGQEEHPSLMVRLYPAVRPGPAWRGRIATLQPSTVAGYPAQSGKPTAKDNAAGLNMCVVLVDLGASQGISTTYSTRNDPAADTCGRAREGAEMVVKKLSH